MILEGVVTNVAAFGAFVDIGVHQDGLVHVSALANKFVKDPHEIVKPGQIVKVRVMDVDVKRQRVSLTMRLDDALGDAPRSNQGRPEGNPNTQHSQRDKQPPPPNRQLNRPAQPTGLFAIALEATAEARGNNAIAVGNRKLRMAGHIRSHRNKHRAIKDAGELPTKGNGMWPITTT
jgi:uncharacterized protein